MTGPEPLRTDPGTRTTVPSGATELLLAEAVAAARGAAAERVRDDLGGFDIAHLASTTDGAVLSLLRASERLTEGLREEALWDVVARDRSPGAPGTMVVPPGSPDPRPVPEHVVRTGPHEVDEPALVVGAVEQLLDGGATLVMNRIDQFSVGELRRFSEDLEALFGIVVGTNAYVSRNAARGFGRHWDDHDVLVLQLEGRKMWEVFEPTVLSPVRGVVPDDAAGRAAWSGLLGPGDAMFVPRGWAHRTIALDELSVHYTVGLHRPTWCDALAGAGPSGAATAEEVAARLVALGEHPEQLLELAHAAVWSRVPTRARASVADTDAAIHGGSPDEWRVVPRLAAPTFVFGPATEDGEVLLHWADRDVLLSAGEAADLAAAMAPAAAPGRPVEGLAPDRPLATRLLLEGLARVERVRGR